MTNSSGLGSGNAEGGAIATRRGAASIGGRAIADSTNSGDGAGNAE